MKKSAIGSVGKQNKFILFVSGMSPHSINAIRNIGKICDKYMPGDYELEIIDIIKQKQQAAAYQIIALPTLIRLEPEPKRIILGDLSNTSKVLKILNINP